MSRGTFFPTSPSAEGEQRKFINPTPGWVGANKFGPDGKPTAVAVEPGGFVWLTAAEERMTAEAPQHAANNPFVQEWEEPIDYDSNGQLLQSVTRVGTLVLADEAPRPVASDRFIPPVATPVQSEADLPEPDPAKAADAEPEEQTVTGAPPLPSQPPVEGQPSPDEVVGTPEAVAANDEALEARASTAEQKTKTKAGAGIPG